MRPTYVDGNDVIAVLFSSGDSGIANQQCEGLLKRKLRYSFSAQSRRDFPASVRRGQINRWSLWRRPWRAPCASNFGLKFASRLNSLWIGRLGARSAICIGVLVMGTETLPRNKERRPAEPSLRVDENTDRVVSLPEENDAPSLWGDEHSYDMHSLLEENALLRRILVKMDLVLKKVVDPK